MATAYHNEALRKQRVIERKKEATRRFIDQHGQVGQNQAPVDAAPKKDKIMYSEPGHYEQNSFRSARAEKRERELLQKLAKKEAVIFEEVVHDPNFNFRVLRETGQPLIHVDRIYRIILIQQPNRIYHRRCRAENEPKDKVSPLLHPPEYNFVLPYEELPPRKPHFKVHLYFRIGVQRERRQYDHSRDGPILGSSRYQLKKEFNFISKSTPMFR